MKKLFIFLLALSFIFGATSFNSTAYSEEKLFARILSDDVGFYLDDTGNELIFFLPYTYYVEVLSLGEPYSHVRIYGNDFNPPMDGYVLSEKLFFDGTVPQNPYPKLNLYTVETTPLYSEIGKGKVVYNVFKDRKLNFYGFALDENGNYYYFVSYNDYLGYVKESSLKEFNYTLHPNPLPQDEPPEDSEPIDTTPKKDDSLIKGIIIACLIFASLLIIAVLIKPSKGKYDLNRYYDDNDYE